MADTQRIGGHPSDAPARLLLPCRRVQGSPTGSRSHGGRANGRHAGNAVILDLLHVVGSRTSRQLALSLSLTVAPRQAESARSSAKRHAVGCSSGKLARWSWQSCVDGNVGSRNGDCRCRSARRTQNDKRHAFTATQIAAARHSGCRLSRFAAVDALRHRGKRPPHGCRWTYFRTCLRRR